MGAVFQTMLPATFRGVPFRYISGDITGGRKTITHEYPNKDFRFVEDLGLNLRTFSIRGIVAGALYAVEKLALERALNQPGIGILTHPYVGIIEVVATGFTVTESLTSTGIAEYTMTFSEAFKSTFPSAILNNLSTIAELFATIYGSVGDDFNNSYSTSTSDNVLDSSDRLKDLSEVLLVIGSTVPALKESDTNFTVEALKFEKESFVIAGPSGDIGNNTSLLINDFDSLTTEGQSRFDASSQLIGFGKDDEFLDLLAQEIKERTKNAKLLNGLINGLAFINICDAAKDIDYKTEEDVNNVANKIDSFFDMINESNTISFTPTFFEQIEEMRTQIRIFFEQTRLVVNKIIEVTTNSLPMTIIAYSYYGNTDEYEDLVKLNNITNPAIVEGTIKILEA